MFVFNTSLVFLRWAIPGLFFLFSYFLYFIVLLVDKNFYRDLNRGSLVLEAAALPTEPPPMLPSIAFGGNIH